MRERKKEKWKGVAKRKIKRRRRRRKRGGIGIENRSTLIDWTIATTSRISKFNWLRVGKIIIKSFQTKYKQNARVCNARRGTSQKQCNLSEKTRFNNILRRGLLANSLVIVVVVVVTTTDFSIMLPAFFPVAMIVVLCILALMKTLYKCWFQWWLHAYLLWFLFPSGYGYLWWNWQLLNLSIACIWLLHRSLPLIGWNSIKSKRRATETAKWRAIETKVIDRGLKQIQQKKCRRVFLETENFKCEFIVQSTRCIQLKWLV